MCGELVEKIVWDHPLTMTGLAEVQRAEMNKSGTIPGCFITFLAIMFTSSIQGITPG